MDIDVKFRKALKSYRQRYKMTQDEMAKKIGTSRTRVCDIERGRCVPTITTIFEWAERLGMRVTFDIFDPKTRRTRKKKTE